MTFRFSNFNLLQAWLKPLSKVEIDWNLLFLFSAKWASEQNLLSPGPAGLSWQLTLAQWPKWQLKCWKFESLKLIFQYIQKIFEIVCETVISICNKDFDKTFVKRLQIIIWRYILRNQDWKIFEILCIIFRMASSWNSCCFSKTITKRTLTRFVKGLYTITYLTENSQESGLKNLWNPVYNL